MTLSTSFAETKQVWLTDVPSFGPDSDMTILRSHSEAFFLAPFLQTPLEGALLISTHQVCLLTLPLQVSLLIPTHLSADTSPTGLTSYPHTSVCWHFPYRSHFLSPLICPLKFSIQVSLLISAHLSAEITSISLTLPAHCMKFAKGLSTKAVKATASKLAHVCTGRGQPDKRN